MSGRRSPVDLVTEIKRQEDDVAEVGGVDNPVDSIPELVGESDWAAMEVVDPGSV
jgi:hypothetical protein